MRVAWKLSLILVFFVMMSGVSCAESIDRIIAVVNGDIILYSELQDQIRIFKMIKPDLQIDDPSRKAQIEQDVLRQMIRDRLTEQEVKRLKIVIQKREVDEAVEGMKRDSRLPEAQFQAKIKESGQTMDQFREGVKKELERNRLMERVLRSKVVISEPEVDAFIKSGAVQMGASTKPATPPPPPPTASGPQKIRLGIIFLPAASGQKNRQAAEKLGREISEKLKGGADFRTLAIQYSKGPAAAEGGDVGYVTLDELAPHIAAGVKNLKQGETSDLVKAQDGCYIFRVFDVGRETSAPAVVPATPAPAPEAGIREIARRQLYQKELNRRFEEWIRDLESRSFIKITL